MGDGIKYPVHADPASSVRNKASCVRDSSGMFVAICDSPYRSMKDDDGIAVRIAAALNATQHIPTEQLEQIDHKTKRLLPVETGRAIPIKRVAVVDIDRERSIEAEKAKDEERLRAVNAELLEALRRSDAALDVFSPFATVSNSDGSYRRLIDSVREQSAAAIAKATEVTSG